MSQSIVDSFLGLSRRMGYDRAEKLNLIFRLIRIGNEQFMDYPEDVRTDRVCAEIDAGAITKATIR